MSKEKLLTLHDLQYLISGLLKFIEGNGSYGAYLASSNVKLAKHLIDSMIEDNEGKLESVVYVFNEKNECVNHFIA